MKILIKRKTILYFLLALILSAIWSSCVSIIPEFEKAYQGPLASNEEIAVLITDKVLLFSINDQIIFRGVDPAWEFLPGEYKLLVKYYDVKGGRAYGSKELEINFTAEAGHNYVLADIGGVHRFKPFIEDITNSEYNPDFSKLTKEKYLMFNQKILKGKTDRLKRLGDNRHSKLESIATASKQEKEKMRMSSVRTYGAFRELKKSERKYTEQFKQASTTYIWIELCIENFEYQKTEHEHDIVWIWLDSYGYEIGRMEDKFMVRPEWKYAWTSRYYGWREPGKWPIGVYTAVVKVDEKEVGRTTFKVNRK